MKKYELTDEYINFYGRTLYRIRALKSFGDVQAGDLGGYVESEKNLSQEGECWIYDKAKAFDDSRIYDDAMIFDNVEIYNNVKIYDNVKIFDNVKITCNVEIYDNVGIYNNVRIYGNSKIYGGTIISSNACISSDAEIFKDTHCFCVGPIGSRDNFTTFFRSIDKKIMVQCGYFSGTIEEFEKAVLEKHKGTKHEKTYKLAIELAKEQIELD